MNNTALKFDRVQEAKKHILFHHNPKDSDGYITIARKSRESGKFIQYHYKPEELAHHLSEWMGEDVFYSCNTFYKPQRRIENIRQLKSLYIDLDFYIFNYDPSWIMGKLEYEYYRKSIPEPNLIIFSGQGAVLIWLIEPAPYKALPLWQAIQNHFLKQLESLGGDAKAVDAARVFRIAGSTSSKNGETVHVQYRHEHRYELRQIQYDYLPELKPKNIEKAKHTRGRKKKIIHLFNSYTLHLARTQDLAKLVELRGYDVEGYRETICFLYRYWTCCFTNDPKEALEQTLDFNSMFTKPLPEKEVIRATKSAEKAYEAKSSKEANEIAIKNGYVGAGYNISNEKLIKWLDITPEEQTVLGTIISKKEKSRRDLERKRLKRREEGKAERAQYLAAENEKTERNLQKLKEILEEKPGLSIRKLAKEIGLSVGYVHKLKNML